jgi:hypothetical protein
MPRGAPAASTRTPQRACEGLEELDSSHAHLRRFLVKATDEFSAVETESRLICSLDFVHPLRRHRIACCRCASARLGRAVPNVSGRRARPLFERLAFHSSGGAGATIPGCPAPQASPIPPFPFSSVLLISSLLPLLLPPKPHFSVATPSFLSSDGSRVISFFASQSLHNKKKLKKIRRCK